MIELKILMSPNILATKLYIPPYRPNLVQRTRLLEKLSGSLQAGVKITLISAPAGFGKTTLVTEWIAALADAEHETNVAWISLDETDNELVVFLSYLVSAIQKCIPSSGEKSQRMLEGGAAPQADAVLLPLLNDLANLSTPLLLVLDDYHAIQQPAIHAAMTFLIEHQPPHMETIITTRQDPLFPLTRWRARAMLVEIRSKDLRFTEQEAAEFLNHTIGLNLQAEDVTVLENRTEGWIAGLQLAAVSLQQSILGDCGMCRPDFIQDFLGNDRFVMDYLVDEALCCQTDEIQKFLLNTSVLERFNAGLCATVVEGESSGNPAAGTPPVSMPASSILEYLDRSNLFLIPLDNRREWYRYHHLFAEMLQYRLQVSKGEAYLDNLKRQASLWFEEHGYPDDAIRYAQAAADWQLSARLIDQHSQALMMRSESLTLLRWLRPMPDEVIRSNPALCRNYGYALNNTGNIDLGKIYFQLAEQGFANNPADLGVTLAFASYNSCFLGDFLAEIDQAQRALNLLPEENTWMRGVAYVSLGIGLCHVNDPQGCEEAMRAAYSTGQKSNTIRTLIFSLDYLGRMAVLRLDFAQAEALFKQAAHLQVDGQPFPGGDMLLFDLALLKYEQNELDQAAAYVEQGLETNQRSGSIEMRAYGYRLAARLNQLKGEKETAREYLDKALQLGVDLNLSPLSLSLNAAWQVEMALWEGNLNEAETAAPRVVNSLGMYSFNFYPEMARVHLLLARGRKADALALLEPALSRAELPGWDYPRLQVRVLQALAASDAGQARNYLRQALILAIPAGAMRTFIDLGTPMRLMIEDFGLRIDECSLMIGGKEQDQSANKEQLLVFINRVLSAFPRETLNLSEQSRTPISQTAIRTQQSKINNLIEPLSDREIEVLRLLADGLSNLEIAHKLFLSPNTLKAHTQNIYAKLDVHSRVQAVNKARELGYLGK
jgi:LuxR family transcriptional regulator, maltose regulon positive regulatory protein